MSTLTIANSLIAIAANQKQLKKTLSITNHFKTTSHD